VGKLAHFLNVLRAKARGYWEAEPGRSVAIAGSVAALLADYGMDLSPGTVWVLLAIALGSGMETSRRRSVPVPPDVAKAERVRRRKAAQLRTMRMLAREEEEEA